MPKLKRIGSLQLEQDLEFQRSEWTVERWGRLLLALFVVCAAIGLFGNGYFGRAQASSPSGSLVVEYDRLARRETPSTLLVEAGSNPDSEIGIWFSDSHLRHMKIEQVIPQQIRTEVAPQRATYVFRTGSDGRGRVRFEIQPQTAGTFTGHIGVVGGESVTFRSFVYP